MQPGIDPAHPPSIKPFGTLVAIGVYIGSIVAMRHAKQRGLDDKKMNEFIFWVVGLGFVGGHMLDAIFYHPDRLAHDPLYLFMIWDGLSSYGGFIGAVMGAFAWRVKPKRADPRVHRIVCSAFPLAWVFGRSGCSTVHDHPGRLSDAWFAVRWPMGHGIAGRFDLGLYEMVLTIPLAVAFAVLWHRKPLAAARLLHRPHVRRVRAGALPARLSSRRRDAICSAATRATAVSRRRSGHASACSRRGSTSSGVRIRNRSRP